MCEFVCVRACVCTCMCTCVCIAYRQVIKWLLHQLVPEGIDEYIGHFLDESGSGFAVVLNGENDWIVAGHKRKLVNGFHTFLQVHYESETTSFVDEVYTHV